MKRPLQLVASQYNIQGQANTNFLKVFLHHQHNTPGGREAEIRALLSGRNSQICWKKL